jgi:hypothetical protein
VTWLYRILLALSGLGAAILRRKNEALRERVEEADAERDAADRRADAMTEIDSIRRQAAVAQARQAERTPAERLEELKNRMRRRGDF